MIFSIYRKTVSVLMKRPFKLWGLSLLVAFLSVVALIGFSGVPAVAFAIGLLLSASMELIYLKSYRTGSIPATADLFTAFQKGQLWHVLGGMAWRELWIFLWLLLPIAALVAAVVMTVVIGSVVLGVLLYLAAAALFVFPLIRKYRYLFVPYILMTQPEVKATDALRISTEQTNGYKGKLYLAEILPALLLLVAGFLLGLLGKIPYLGILFKICQVVLTVAYYLLAPLFLGLVRAAFYDEIQAERDRRAWPNPNSFGNSAPQPQQPIVPTAPVAPAPAQEDVPTAPAPAEPPVEAVPETTPIAETAPAPETTPAPEVPTKEPARFCTNCGALLTTEGAAFCTVCGQRVED